MHLLTSETGVRRAAVFPFIAISGVSIRKRPVTPSSPRLRFTVTKSRLAQTEGTCPKTFQLQSTFRRITKVRFVGRVRSDVVQHRIDCRCQWLKSDDSGKDHTIADLSIDHERGSLRDLKRTKFGRRCSNALFNCGRFRALEQFPGINRTCLATDFSGNIPISNSFTVTQRGARKRKPNAIISKTKVLRRFRHAIGREPLRKTRIVPVGIEYERRTHHHSAAPIKPLLLLA